MKARFDRFIENVVVLLYSALCIIVFAAVVARYVFKHPLIWSDEVIIYLFTWVVFMGSAIAYKNKKHISISIFTSFLPQAVQRSLDLAGDLLVLLFLVFLLYQSTILYQMNRDVPSFTIPVPVSVMAFSLPVMAVLMIYYNVSSIIEKLKPTIKAGQVRLPADGGR